MGALLSVAQGGPEPPRVMVVTYTPASPKPGALVIGLVGKAVTSTLAASPSTCDGMEKMKYDMAAAHHARRHAEPRRPQASVKVICVVPSTKTCPAAPAKAWRHSDRHVGKTIEVLNTDAEAASSSPTASTTPSSLVHASRRRRHPYRCHRRRLATSTSASSAPTNPLRQASPAPNRGEKMWADAIDDDYRDFIKGSFADIQNISSGKGGAAITGAMFIKEFTGDSP